MTGQLQITKMLKIGSNATASDWIKYLKSAISAKKTGPKKIEVLMSENCGAHVNSTGS